MNFRKVNNITGWAVFLVALVTYMMTREARGSLWDCGEFVASAKGMQLPHPPGAPLFTLLGRFFIVLFGDNGNSAANAVNFMSALASAATILFLFWSITHFARKLFVKAGEELTGDQIATVMLAGAVGGLAYTFSDSFWFSAVEGEVYALSSFFTALVFWAILKWEHSDERAGTDGLAKARSDRWIIFLFFMMGLSIGVHLLNLLTIPAIVMIYYFRNYRATIKGFILAFIIGCLITGLVQVVVIQYSMKAAGLFDVYFVNSLGLPFFSGFTIYFIGVAALIAWALTFNERNITKAKLITWFILFLGLSVLPFYISLGSDIGKFGKFLLIAIVGLVAGYFFKPGALRVLKLSLWCYAFMTIGYFMYFTAIIRSNANPSIDMNDVDNPINLVYYLSREQYGSAPLIYGPHFAATQDDIDEAEPIIEGEMKYIKGKNKYIAIGKQREYNYKNSVKMLFPRIWDSSNDQFHATFYAQWLGLGQDQQTQKYEAPSYIDNIDWFFTYQMDVMYWRYFMWNFAGKQNDVQGMGNARDGNWVSGISLLDNGRLGDQSKMPDSIKQNKAHNELYLLPFILGIIGCVYQFVKNKKDWIVNFLLFFFTGIAVVFYLNQAGNQPRERDYAYVGSFYAFAIWIGLSVVGIVRLAREKADTITFRNVLLFGSALTFVILFMSALHHISPGGLLMTMFSGAILYAAVTALLIYLSRVVSSGGRNGKLVNIAAGIVTLMVPILMGQQEWDDHDRSKKTVAPDLARDYLESCEKNAILFTFGDNDTYPLWYAQEVEGVRPDIRIINNSLLGIDWYINQLRYKVNEADSLDVIFTPEQIEGHNREFMRFPQNAPQTDFYDLFDVMKRVANPVLDQETGRDAGPNSFPVTRLGVPVDAATVRANGTVNPDDSIISPMIFEIPRRTVDRGLYRSDLVILSVIATNKWKRPIYFTSPYGDLGFWNYLRKDGLAYRLVPVANKFPQANWTVEKAIDSLEQKYKIGIGGNQVSNYNKTAMFNNLENKFRFGGADRNGVYFDEENRRHLLSIRSAYGEAAGNLADEGDKEKAQKLLTKAEAGIHTDNLPYGLVSRFGSHDQITLLYLEAAYKAGMPELAEKIRLAVRKDLEEQKKYYDYLQAEKPELYSGSLEGTEVFLNTVMLEVLDAIEIRYAPEKRPKAAGPQPSELPKSITNTPGDSNGATTDTAYPKK